MSQDAPSPAAEPGAFEFRRPTVVARYSLGYEPPFDVAPIIERMLDSIPAKYLVGLSEVVLTNSSGLSRKRRRAATKSRNGKVKLSTARGVYHPAWKGKLAWIEIFVDNALHPLEKAFWLKIPLIRESAFDSVLFHEIGHHIHYTVRPEYREKEDVADVWMVGLEKNYWRQRSGLLRLFLRLSRFLAGPIIAWLHFKAMKYQRNKGWISRAEFEERTRKKTPSLN
jgi:hypothetical protein